MNTQAKTTRLAVDMTEGPLLGKMIKFTIPIILTGILQLLFNATDLVMVGRYAGSAALAGVGCCGSLIQLIINAFMGLSVGAGVTASQAIGAKRQDDLNKIINTAFASSLLAGVAVGVFGFVLSKPLLLLMETPSDVLQEAVPYMKAYFVGIPACLVYNYMAAILRASGDTKRPLIFLSIAGVANVLLNYVMTVYFHLGAMGVGIATAVSQYISAVLVIIHFFSGKSICRITGIKPTGKILAKIVTIGLPAGIQGTLFSLSNVLIQSTVNGYGTVVMAGNAAAGNIEGFMYTSMNAVSQAAINFTGQNAGAGKYERIKKITILAVALVACVAVVMTPVLLIFGEQLIGIYEPGKPDVIAAGMNRTNIIATFYVLCGIMDTLCGVVRGMGRAIPPMIVALIGSCALRILWIYTVCPLFPQNIQALYISYPITWALTAAAHLCLLVFFYKRLMRTKSSKEIKEL
ncbi:MAG: MATE family efflux transporter [Clostridia bacterium]|nr:MATE family efflux transporter [Clostridia bacterium]